MRQFLYALLGCLIFAPLNAQKNSATPKQAPKGWTYFKSAQQISAAQLAQDKSALQLGADDDLQLLSTKNDDLGYRHYRYQQTYKGIPIEGAIYLMHEKNSRTKKANGQLISNISIHTVPHISEVPALQAALQYVGADVYAWEDATHQALIQQVEQCEDATFYPYGDLVIIDPDFGQNPDNYKLAYKFDVYAIAPLSRQVVYIDAQNSAVLTSIERLHSCTDTSASGDSNYSGTVNFTACQENGIHTLKNHLGGVTQQVFNANNTLSNPLIPCTDPDGFFEADPTAVDVHFATQKAYEYFLDSLNRNSLDGDGAPLYSWLHYGNGYNNAGWNGSWMFYGDGDNNNYSPWTAPDVVAHEITHAITAFSNGLIYFHESGALNESFSDIFAEVVEAYIRGNNDWIIGADFTIQSGKNGIRNMSNPNDANMSTRQPDTYLGNYWHSGMDDWGGVHFNSGVQNYWFYLLSEGGSGINDNGDAYNITGIGMSKAAAIAYRNLTTCLTSTSQYPDAREGSIEAAIDLYGADSEEALQTAAAWSAVGLDMPTPDCRMNDSLALAALYDATDGANWTNTWDLAQPMDTWYGITLNQDGCVTCIDMDGKFDCIRDFSSLGNNLSGSLPVEIGNLSNLTALDLSDNELNDSIPGEIGSLSSLTYMDLGNNNLIGSIPSGIGNLSNLTYLILWGNQLSSSIPPEIGNLSNLTYLILFDNQLSGGIPSEIGNLNNLTNLNLSENPLGGSIPPQIGNLNNLTFLYLDNSQLNGSIPLQIGNLNDLRLLDLDNNQLSGNILQEIGNLNDLYYLSLGNNQLSGGIPLQIWNLKKLRYLDLSSNPLGGSISPQIGNLEYLFNLNLSSNQLSGNIPPQIGNLEYLSNLNLSHNQLSDSIPPEIGNLNDLYYLSLGSNQLSGCYAANLINLYDIGSNYSVSDGNNFDAPWEDFRYYGAGACNNPYPNCRYNDSLALVAFYNSTNGASWTNTWDLSQSMNTWHGVNLNGFGCVASLDLGNNNLSGSISPEIGNLTNLRELNLYWNNLSDSIPPEIGNLTNLRRLNLSLNDLSGSIPPEIGNLNNVAYLSLWTNNLSGSIPSEIGNLNNLRQLDLHGNQLSGSLPPEIENLTNLTYLLLGYNELSGSILSQIGNLNNLSHLDLSNNQLSGNIPLEIGNLTHLREIVLSDNQLTGSIPPEIGNLNNLIRLNLHNNQLSGCYDENLMILCSQLTSIYNTYFSISEGNDFDASWEDFCIAGAGTCPPQVSCRQIDSLTLVTLYHSTDGSNWTNTWNLAQPIDTWYGVNINSDDCVWRLHLQNNNLAGQLPAEIGDLSNIEQLHLNENQLTGSLPYQLGNLNNLNSLLLFDNQLDGCYDINLTSICSQLNNSSNIAISSGNNFDVPWEDFCATGAGSCPPVWPGDFNNDGIANNIDAMFWGLAAGNTGAIRPNATTNWTQQAASEWSQSVSGINGKHQDADGNGTVDIDDLDVLVANYGLTHAPVDTAGASSPLEFELRQLSTETQDDLPAIRYGIYLKSSLDVSTHAHGLAFSLDLSEFAVLDTPRVETLGSALTPTASLGVYDPSPSQTMLHVALTRTDKNDQEIIDGDLIAECIVVVKDIPSGDIPSIHANGGSMASANGAITAVSGTSLYSMFDNSGGVSFYNTVSVSHEQCNTLGSARVEVLEGTPPYAYSWSTGANTAQVTHLHAGTYTVEVRDANGQQQIIPIQVNARTAIYDEAGNEIDCSPQIPWLAPELYAILEGPYDANTDTMTNQLQTLNLLPDIQPYQEATLWNYRGTEGQGWTAADYPDGTVDWVLVSFRDAQNADSIIYAKTAALLQQDGSLLFLDNRFLSAETADSLHVVIQHRNHIAAMTPQPLSINNQIITHDFRLSDSYHTSTSVGQKELPDGIWVMFAGDCDPSDEPGYDITGQDKALWFDSNGNFNQYFPPDLNLDGDINGADIILWFENNGINSVAPK